MSVWHILAGEYPPEFGGVGAYTAGVAQALVENGQDVHVWARGREPEPELESEAEAIAPPWVHRVGGGWSRTDLKRLDARLDAFSSPRRILVQYTPNAWGHKGMNLGFCHWLARRARRGDDVRIVFHELWYFPIPGDRLARRALKVVQRLMAQWLLQACREAYVTIPHWGELLGALPAGRGRRFIWLPVPSNIPIDHDPVGVAAIRARFAPAGSPVIGHFGTYSGKIGAMLAAALPEVMRACPEAVVVVIGQNSDGFRDALIAAHPDLAPRLRATGRLDDAEVSRHLQACDLLVQPYPDGVTARRTTVMAGLEHGLPVVTTIGAMTEPVWRDCGGVALVPENNLAAMASAVSRLLAQPQIRAELATAAVATYQRHFHVQRLVESLISSTSFASTSQACSS